ncbi:hypothetical protein [Streptomyces sp. NPDC047042]|uniref:hypothetical protein n=1 Tax=Streptomyces sp. NPDC047042 TaxID=3154807 RepID=UPI00340DC07B
MRRRTRGIRVLVAAVGSTLALGLGTASASASASAAGQGTAAVPCPSGFVCLVSTDGMIRATVMEGATGSLLPAMRAAEITNNTSIWYCVTGTTTRGIAPGDTLFGIDGILVRRLAPSYTGTCPA